MGGKGAGTVQTIRLTTHAKLPTVAAVWLVKDPDCPNFFVSGTAGAQAPSAWSLDITDALLSDGTLGDSNPGPWGVLEDGSVVGEPDQVLTHTLSDEKFASSGVKPKARGVGGAAGESVGAPESGGRQQGWSNAGMDGERWRAGTGGAGGIGGGHILAAGGAHVGRRMDPGRGRFTEF